MRLSKLATWNISAAAFCVFSAYATTVSGATLDAVLDDVKARLPCGAEYRQPRTVVNRRFSSTTSDDLFVFFTTECSNRYDFYLAILQQTQSGLRLLAHGRVGGRPFAFDGVDFGFVRVVGDAFFLRTARAAEDPKYGDMSQFPKVFYRWRAADGQLIRDEPPYYFRRGQFFPIAPVSQ